MQQDIYIWRVTYEDGTHIHEYDPERPDGRGWKEIDATRVKQIDLLSSTELIVCSVMIPDNAFPVFCRRRGREFGIGGNEETVTLAHILGYEQAGIGVYLFIRQDGSILLSRDYQAV